MRTFTIASLALAALLAASGAALAQGGEGLRRMDANQDGKLTRAEAQAARAKLFETVDANRDGAVTPEEAQAARERARMERQQRAMARLDANKDGRISRDEFVRSEMRMFERMDPDGDGVIDLDALPARPHRGGR